MSGRVGGVHPKGSHRASREVVATSKPYMLMSPQLLVPCGVDVRACFHALSRRLINRPWSVRIRTSSSSLKRISFGVPSPQPPSPPFGADSHLPRFPPSLDMTRSRPQTRESHVPLRSVLRRSQPLDGLLRVLAHGFLSPRSRYQGSVPSRGLSTLRSRHLHQALLPPRR
jgi:hypothetical protein